MVVVINTKFVAWLKSDSGKVFHTRKILGISKTVTCLLGMQKLISETTEFFNPAFLSWVVFLFKSSELFTGTHIFNNFVWHKENIV